MSADDDFRMAIRLVGYAPTPELAPDILPGDVERSEAVGLEMFVRRSPQFEDLTAEGIGFALCPGCASVAVRINFAGGLFLLFDPRPAAAKGGPILVNHACPRPRAGRGGGASHV